MGESIGPKLIKQSLTTKTGLFIQLNLEFCASDLTLLRKMKRNVINIQVSQNYRKRTRFRCPILHKFFISGLLEQMGISEHTLMSVNLREIARRAPLPSKYVKYNGKYLVPIFAAFCTCVKTDRQIRQCQL